MYNVNVNGQPLLIVARPIPIMFVLQRSFFLFCQIIQKIKFSQLSIIIARRYYYCKKILRHREVCSKIFIEKKLYSVTTIQ